MRYNIIRNYIRIISFPYRERRQAAKGGVPMKKNRWQQLKYDNENKQWKLEPENQETLEEIIRFLYHEKVGMMESELIRRDLISMAQEAEKNGEKLKTRLGDMEAFARELASERKKYCKEERLYYSLWKTGKYLYILWISLAGIIFVNALSMIRAGLDPGIAEGVNFLFIPYCILLAFLIYSYDIYVQNLFPLKGTGGKVLRGILVVGFLFLLNVLPRFTADLWSSETLEILRVPNLIYLPLILAAWLVSRWGYLRFSQYVERINL